MTAAGIDLAARPATVLVLGYVVALQVVQICVGIATLDLLDAVAVRVIGIRRRAAANRDLSHRDNAGRCPTRSYDFSRSTTTDGYRIHRAVFLLHDEWANGSVTPGLCACSAAPCPA